MANVDLGGRPPIMNLDDMDNDPVVKKLEQAFQNGFNITQACRFAGITRETYYNYLESSDKFVDRMEASQEFAEIKARQNVVNEIMSGDKQASQWWLERKAKDEFSKRDEVTGKDGEPIGTSIEDLVKAVQGVVEDEHNARNNPED